MSGRSADRRPMKISTLLAGGTIVIAKRFVVLWLAAAALTGCNQDSKDEPRAGLCPLPRPPSCSEAEWTTPLKCRAEACRDDIAACFGPDFERGNFSGPWKAEQDCIANCPCGDNACIRTCGPLVTDECAECANTRIPRCLAVCREPDCAQKCAVESCQRAGA
jgi:hypothetical protein